MVSNKYIGAVLDLTGCFYQHKHGKYSYDAFRIVMSDNKTLMRKIVAQLKNKGIKFSVCDLKDSRAYFITNKKSMENLRKFMDKHCLMRRRR